MSDTDPRQPTLYERHRWVPFVMPFVVYMLVGTLEPTPSKDGGAMIGLGISYAYYPWVYAAKIALTLAAAALAWPGYRTFRFRVSWTAVAIGLVGGPLWIGLCSLDVEHRWLLPLLKCIGCGSAESARSAFNPFDPSHGLTLPAAWSFLGVRFLGLVAVVPLIEEFFLRGFMMRFVMERDWWDVPFGKVNGLAIAVGTILPVLSHPEWLAAAVWFSMVTWLMVRTRNIWDCVAAHVLTNLILGLYVVTRGGEAWRLM